MEFDPDKCKMLHFGTLKQGKANTVNYSALRSVVEWSNMGVQGHSSLEVATQDCEGSIWCISLHSTGYRVQELGGHATTALVNGETSLEVMFAYLVTQLHEECH